MPLRTVLQWDKDDCAAVGLVKFDLLGLGMLAALHGTVDLVREAHGVEVDLATIPQDDEVYDMLCRADSVGRVPGRVAGPDGHAAPAAAPGVLRPGGGGGAHPPRAHPGRVGPPLHPAPQRLEEPTYLHPLLKPALEKTLGVPLFQEQLMQMAIDVAGFTPAEADQLRQAMGSKRSHERMEALRRRLYDGMAANGVVGEVADRIWEKLAAFASYGFPESHSVSFAYLVYASSWLKRYYPAAFCAALLNAQPMGFYSPHSLTQDARRHGVEVRTPDLALSGVGATLEVGGAGAGPVAGKGAPPDTWGRGGPAVRLGLGAVRGIGDDLARRIVAERDARGPYTRPEDLVRRVPGLTAPQLEALATAGALGGFGLDRRRALWVAGAVARTGPDRLAGIVTGVDAPTLPGLEPLEVARADLWATGVSPEGHPTRFVRDLLDGMGVVRSDGLVERPHGSRVTVAGVVTHRQRPATAGGTTFVNLEDEAGLLNIVVSKGCWAHHRRVVRTAPALLVRGRLERVDGVTNVLAERIRALPIKAEVRSRDFR